MRIDHYSFGGQRIDIRRLESDRWEATIFAPESAERNSLQHIPHILERNKLEALPVIASETGQEKLCVTGFKKPEDLFDMLRKEGVISGEATRETQGEDRKRSFKERFSRRSVSIASMAGMFGHAWLIGDAGVRIWQSKGLESEEERSPIKKGAYRKMLVGGFYAAANIFGAVFGSGKAGGELQQSTVQIQESFKNNGIPVAQNLGMTDEDLKRPKTSKEKTLGFFENQAFRITQALGLIGNIFFTTTKEKSEPWKDLNLSGKVMESWDKISGVSSAAAAISILTFREQPEMNSNKRLSEKTAETLLSEEQEKSGWQKFREKVKPTSIAGPGLMISDLSMVAKAGMQAYDNYQTVNRDGLTGRDKFQQHYTTITTAGTALGWSASGLSMFLAKTIPPADYSTEEAQEHFVSKAALEVLKQPEELRGVAIDVAAETLAKRHDVVPTEEELAKLLFKRVNELQESCWVGKVQSTATETHAIPFPDREMAFSERHRPSASTYTEKQTAAITKPKQNALA